MRIKMKKWKFSQTLAIKRRIRKQKRNFKPKDISDINRILFLIPTDIINFLFSSPILIIIKTKRGLLTTLLERVENFLYGRVKIECGKYNVARLLSSILCVWQIADKYRT